MGRIVAAMSRRIRWLVGGSVVLVTLAGCGRYFQFPGEREPWRREAEVACLNSGTVKEGAGIVRISPIEEGMCGADFPMKVSALGEGSALGYTDEPVRPPGSIPGVSSAQQPRWPITRQSYPPPASPPYGAPQSPQSGAPISLAAPGAAQDDDDDDDARPMQLGAPPAYLRAPAGWRRNGASSAVQSRPYPPPTEPSRADVPPQRPQLSSPPQQQPPPPLGPPRAQPVAASMPVEVRPSATLACPIVSALERWLVDAVQPAAQKWFQQPVVEIKQISSYSCRGMNGQAGAHISEHAFGNALDIAAFVLANGHRITVKNGWKGSPEEQGFLRDVQGSACDQFTTVLAPGSNRFHYDHIHVNLMRRASGRRICEPGAIDGEVVAARARKGPTYASRPINPPPTRNYDPPIDPQHDPFAWRGDRRDPAVTGSISARRPGVKNPADEDADWVEEPGPRPAIDWSANRHKVF